MKENYKNFKSYYLKEIKFIDNGYEKTEMKEDCIKYINYLENNWNELKKGLQSLFEFDEGVVSKDYLECAEDTLEKMQELEGNNDSKRDV